MYFLTILSWGTIWIQAVTWVAGKGRRCTNMEIRRARLKLFVRTSSGCGIIQNPSIDLSLCGRVRHSSRFRSLPKKHRRFRPRYHLEKYIGALFGNSSTQKLISGASKWRTFYLYKLLCVSSAINTAILPSTLYNARKSPVILILQ